MTKEFWRAALIRAIKTICQTAIATIGTAMVLSDVAWKYVISASLLAGLLSILTSIATGLPEVDMPNEMTVEDAMLAIEESEYLWDELEEFEGDDDEV